MSLHCLVYVSSAIDPFSDESLLELLETSRRNNAERSITGMLLYKDGAFMQALEGEKDAVHELYGRIQMDSRHTGVFTLVEGPLEHRDFPTWSMGFQNLNPAKMGNVPGFEPFWNVPLTREEFRQEPSRARRLLLLFTQHM